MLLRQFLGFDFRLSEFICHVPPFREESRESHNALHAGTATRGLQRSAADAGSPINGLLYLSGTVGGSKDRPTGELAVRLYDGAIGALLLNHSKLSQRR
jgi:hypothetical protein